MRYLLDTNIVSALIRPAPPETLLTWMAERTDDELYIATLTLAEIRKGILELPRGKRRDAFEAWFAGAEGPQNIFAGRILPFDEAASLIWARMMAAGKAKGRPRNPLDTIVAAVAEAHGCVVVTDNEKDFADVRVINPVRGAIR